MHIYIWYNFRWQWYCLGLSSQVRYSAKNFSCSCQKTLHSSVVIYLNSSSRRRTQRGWMFCSRLWPPALQLLHPPSPQLEMQDIHTEDSRLQLGFVLYLHVQWRALSFVQPLDTAKITQLPVSKCCICSGLSPESLSSWIVGNIQIYIYRARFTTMSNAWF